MTIGGVWGNAKKHLVRGPAGSCVKVPAPIMPPGPLPQFFQALMDPRE